MNELNLGDYLYYIDKNAFKIRKAPIIKKTIELHMEGDKEVRKVEYRIKYGASVNTFTDKGNVLTSTDYFYYAFKTQEDLINYLTN